MSLFPQETILDFGYCTFSVNVPVVDTVVPDVQVTVTV